MNDALTLVELIRRGIEDEISRSEEYVSTGRPESWDDYRETIGVLTGLRRSLNTVIEIRRKYLEDDIGDDGT